MNPLRSRAVKQTTLSSPLRILAVADGETVMHDYLAEFNSTLTPYHWPRPASAANRCIGRCPPKGNPTLKTLLAVLKAVGMRLSVEAEDHALA